MSVTRPRSRHEQIRSTCNVGSLDRDAVARQMTYTATRVAEKTVKDEPSSSRERGAYQVLLLEEPTVASAAPRISSSPSARETH